MLANYIKAQSFLGLRTEVSSVMINTKNQVKLNHPISFAPGIAFHYTFTPTIEMTSDLLLSFYKLKSELHRLEEVNNNIEFVSKGDKSLNMFSLDFTYTLLKGFGEEQHYKAGLGVFVNLTKSNYSATSSNEFWGYYKPNVSTERYDPKFLYSLPNFGLVGEVLYNVNDALQFSLRYKAGLPNTYRDGDQIWKQSYLGFNTIYYFGTSDRGSIKSSKSKSKVNF